MKKNIARNGGENIRYVSAGELGGEEEQERKGGGLGRHPKSQELHYHRRERERERKRLRVRREDRSVHSSTIILLLRGEML